METAGFTEFCVISGLLLLKILSILGHPVVTSEKTSTTTTPEEQPSHVILDDEIPLPFTSTISVNQINTTSKSTNISVPESQLGVNKSDEFNHLHNQTSEHDLASSGDHEMDVTGDYNKHRNVPRARMRQHLHMHDPGRVRATSNGTNTHHVNMSHILDPDHVKAHSTWSKKFHNYKLLYDTMKAQHKERKNQTEFYAWIFGGTMLVLATVSTAVSCVVFCFCGGEKWRRPKRLRVDDGGEYHRVENVYPRLEEGAECQQCVESNYPVPEREEGSHPANSVTVI